MSDTTLLSLTVSDVTLLCPGVSDVSLVYPAVSQDFDIPGWYEQDFLVPGLVKYDQLTPPSPRLLTFNAKLNHLTACDRSLTNRLRYSIFLQDPRVVTAGP